MTQNYEHYQKNRFLYILSTGRCGTQWLADVLKDIYTDLAVVEHEPIGPAYSPKTTLRCPDALERLSRNTTVGKHLGRIDNIMTRSHYIECGWPAFAAIPLFRKRYGDRLRVIHLTRHPVWTALSYQTVNHYQLLPGDQWLAGELDPWDSGIRFKTYQDTWNSMSAYEKSLFQWLEVHTWAEELKRTYPDLPFSTIRMEDLFSSSGHTAIDEILWMAGLPHRRAVYDRLSSRVDAHQQGTNKHFEWQQIYNHPAVLDLADRLGYRFDNIQSEKLLQRYKSPFLERIKKNIKSYKRYVKRLLLSSH